MDGAKLRLKTNSAQLKLKSRLSLSKFMGEYAPPPWDFIAGLTMFYINPSYVYTPIPMV